MNREEILKKSQIENKGKTDERDAAINQRSCAISQAFGLLGCLTIAIFANDQYGACAWTLYFVMLTSEYLASAIQYKKSVWRWLVAAVCLVGLVLWSLSFAGVLSTPVQ